jgi:hypothetical protein
MNTNPVWILRSLNRILGKGSGASVSQILPLSPFIESLIFVAVVLDVDVLRESICDSMTCSLTR